MAGAFRRTSRCATTPDVAGPEPESASVPAAGDSIAIVFDEALDETDSRLPVPGRFAVTAADGAVFTVGTVAVDGVTVTLTLASDSPTVRTGQALTVVYADATSNDDTAGVIQDDDGNDAADFTLGPGMDMVSVTNGSTQAVGPPGVPGNVEAESGGDDRIVVRWDAPADTGGQEITGYRVEVSTDGTTFTVLAENHDTMNSEGRFEYVHTGLEVGDERWYRISARNGSTDADVGTPSVAVQGVVDKKGDVVLSVASASVAESGEVAWTVTATADAGETPASDLAMEVRVTSADGTALAPDDYTALDATVTFVRGDFAQETVDGELRWVARKTGTVAIVDDVTVEGEERFALAMAVGGGGDGWVTGTDEIEIAIEDDDEWTITVSAEPPSMVEGETREVELTARITRGDGSAPPTDGCIAPFAVRVGLGVGGTATGEGTDYTLEGETDVREIEACEHEASWTVRLDTAVDRVDDPDETVTFAPELEGMLGMAPAELNAATVTLRQESGVRVSRQTLSMQEGRSRTYTVSLTAPPTATVTVTLRVQGDTDVTVSPAQLEFTTTDWHLEQTVTVMSGDDADEEDDTATVEHSVSSTGGYGGVSAGSVEVSVRDSTGARIWGAVRLGDRIDFPDGSAIGRLEVAYKNRWGTVCDDRQFLGNLTPVLACRLAGFATGEHERNRNSAEFNLLDTADDMPIQLDDVMCLPGVHDDAERLDQCHIAGYPGSQTNCTRQDDLWVKCTGTLPQGDSPALGAMPKILAGDGTGLEGAYGGMARFKVILTKADSVNTITVKYRTRDVPGTDALAPDFQGLVPTRARVGADYTAVDGTLTFDPGVTSGVVEVPIIDDGIEDSNEMFELVLSEPSGALIGDATGTGLIFNRDPLAAEFESVPAAHGGEAFGVGLAFSQAVEADAGRIEAALSVTGGEVTEVTGPDAEGKRFEVTVTPSGTGTVTVELPPPGDCEEENAVCTADGLWIEDAARTVVAHSVEPLATPVARGPPQVGGILEASFAETPEGSLAWQWLRDGEEIEGAGSETYAPVAADLGARLSVRVSRDAETATSAATAPVWPEAGNPALAAGEEELLSAVLTVGTRKTARPGSRMTGFSEVGGVAFGALDPASFGFGGATYRIGQLVMGRDCTFGLETDVRVPEPAGLVVYWNRDRIGSLMHAGPGGMLTHPLPETCPAHLQAASDAASGAPDGARVAISLRRARTAVRVTGVSVTSSPGDNGAWDAGETVEAEVRFDAPVTVTGGPPTLGILLDGARREAAYAGGSGTDRLAFTWTVTDADDGARRARVVSNGLSLEGATLGAGANAVVETGFWVAPFVTAVAVAPDASGDRAWTPGEAMEVRLTFSEPVTVEGGNPWLDLAVEGFAYPAVLGYASGSGSAVLAFSRDVPANMESLAGLSVAADSLVANGATIVSAASGLAAELGHDGTEPTAAPEEGSEAEPLTASFLDLPDSHGGAPFTLTLRFGEELPLGYAALRDAALAAAGGQVSAVRRTTQGSNREWAVTVTPQDGAGDVTVTLPARACGETGAVCTADGRGLAADVTAAVPAAVSAETPFRVRLKDVPDEHDGSGEVAFEVVFNKAPADLSFTTLRDRTLRIARDGTVLAPEVRRLLDGADRNREWAVTVLPGGKADVTVSVGPFAACSDTGAVCASGGEVLSNAVTATIQGPPGLSVADARAYEAAGATVDFAVTLGRASQHTVTVDYATSDGTAEAGSDYEAASGTLTFAPGETAKTVPVAVLNDAHDEGEETFTLTLSNPQGGNAWLADATATGTIENTDAMPQAWLARFGRTVAEQAIEAVEGRLAASRRPGVEVTLAGERIGAGGAAPEDAEARAQLAEEREARSRLEAMTQWLRGEERDGDGARPDSRSVTERDLLLGSSFSLTGAAKAGGLVSLWGRGAVSRFDGREGDLTLSGEVTSVMLGADWARDLWTAGLLVSRSVGAGSYRSDPGSGSGTGSEGTVESTLTGLYPYGRYEATERVTLWGVAGYGAGDLVLTPEGRSAMRADMDLMMGAVGLRGVAVEAPAEGGVELAVKPDAMAVRTSSERTQGLAAATATVTRLRLGLEGTWRGLEAGGGALAPRLEVGVRHDGGDAETGFGLDLGGGLAWTHPAAGVSAELSGRGLLTHESKGFRDRGLSGSFAWNPGQGSGRGPKLTLTQTLGGSPSGGMDALLGRRHLEGLAANDDRDDLANRRLELRMGYGFSAFGDRFASTPELGLGLSNGAREYTLGWRLNRRGGPSALGFRVEGTRREAAGANDDAAPEHGVGLRVTARW